MTVNVNEIEAIANELLTVAGMFSPQVAGAGVAVNALIKLFQTGQKFNGLLKDIMEQTPENADAVRAAVIAAYKSSEDDLQAAIDAAKA